MGCLFRQLLFADKNAVQPAPLMRTIPMPPVPMGVEIAAITSSSIYSLFIETSFLEGLCPSNFLQGESGQSIFLTGRRLCRRLILAVLLPLDPDLQKLPFLRE